MSIQERIDRLIKQPEKEHPANSASPEVNPLITKVLERLQFKNLMEKIRDEIWQTGTLREDASSVSLYDQWLVIGHDSGIDVDDNRWSRTYVGIRSPFISVTVEEIPIKTFAQKPVFLATVIPDYERFNLVINRPETLGECLYNPLKWSYVFSESEIEKVRPKIEECLLRDCANRQTMGIVPNINRKIQETEDVLSSTRLSLPTGFESLSRIPPKKLRSFLGTAKPIGPVPVRLGDSAVQSYLRESAFDFNNHEVPRTERYGHVFLEKSERSNKQVGEIDASVGQSIEIGGLDIAVLRVEKGRVRFVTQIGPSIDVFVKIKNLSCPEAIYSCNSFRLLTPDGRLLGSRLDPYSGPKGEIPPFGTIVQGGTVEGKIYFEVEKASSLCDLYVVYDRFYYDLRRNSRPKIFFKIF